MNVSQVFLCILTMSFTGCIAGMIIKMYWNLTKDKNPYLMIFLIKIALVLFLFPAAFVVISIMSMRYINGAWLIMGDFFFGTTRVIGLIFNSVGMIWFIGCVIRIIDICYQYWNLYSFTRGNVPIENTRYLEMFEEHKMAKGISKVSICHNDLLVSPIVVGFIKPTVILPYAKYSEKELRIFYEHELNHLKCHDLIWRALGIVVTAIHWFNPLAYILFNDLMFYQEVISDCNSTKSEIYFSTKEYGMLLAGLQPNKHINVHMTAIGETPNKILRRIQIMVNSKKLKRTKKSIVVCCSFALLMLSVLPTCLVTVKAADMQNKWIKDTEESIEYDNTAYGEPVRLQLPEEDIKEIVITSTIQTLSSSFHLDYTIPADTRVLYNPQKMSAGDKVSIIAHCADSSLTYRIGIKNTTGTVWYTQGTGTLINTFTVESDGTYAAFVQNMTGTPLAITGTAVYP